MARRPVAALAVLLAGLAGALLGGGSTRAADAAPVWSVSYARTGGSVSMATLSARYTLVSGPGAGGSTFSVRSLLFGTSSVLRLENTGSVPVALTTTATLQPVFSGSIEVWECSSAFSSGSCPTGAVASLLSSASGLVTHVQNVTTSRVVPVGGAIHLKVVTSGGVYNEALLTTSVGRTRGPLDRTAG